MTITMMATVIKKKNNFTL